LGLEADARPEVQSWQYSFAGSIRLVFASGVGLCFGQPQLRGERRFEGRGEDGRSKDALLAREAGEQVDDFAGWVKAKRVEFAPHHAVLSRGSLNDGRRAG
jgi:hypothetical protein